MPVTISPGVYTNFYELTTYVQEVPSSTGFIPFFSDKGPDNVLTAVYNINKFIKLYGEPNYLKYTPQFGGGHLVAYSFMQVSPKMYAMRVLPNDARRSNKFFFLILERPATITADDFEVEITHNAQGVLTGATFINPYAAQLPTNHLGDFFWYSEIETNDPAVRFTFNRFRLMNYRLNGSRSFPTAFANLYTIIGGDPVPTGSYILNDQFEIGISGTGNLRVGAINNNGRVFVHVDQPEVILLDISAEVNNISSVDINAIIDDIKNNWRPKYIVNNWVLGAGSQINPNLYNVNIRRRLPRERGVEKTAIIVPSLNGSNVYVVRIIPNNLAPSGYTVQFTPLPTGVNVHQALKNYSTVIKVGVNNMIFNLRVDDSNPANPQLVWEIESATADVNWDNTFEVIMPLFGVFGKYRGKYYDNYRIQFLQIENEEDRFIFNVYEKKRSGEVQNSEFYTSFVEDARDRGGELIYIKSLVDRFSDDIILEDYKERRIDLLYNFYDALASYGMVPQARVIENTADINESGWYYIKSNAVLNSSPVGIDALTFQQYLGSIIFVRTDGNILNGPNIVYGITSNNAPMLNYLNTVFVFQRKPHDYEYTIVSDSGVLYRGEEPDSFVIIDGINEYDNTTGVYLSNGSDGSLFLPNGQINETVARQLLIMAYLGLIDDMVRKSDFVWFDIVMDGGYPSDVKNAIVQLVNDIRRDCIALVDNGDNRNVTEALRKRSTVHSWNSYFVALYEPYIQIFDVFSGRDIWVTPIYAVARLVALNDRVNEVWYGVAGYTRGVSNVIKALRFSPSELSERDDLYLAQINPFVTFRDGTVLWGQLTTYKKPSNYQDLNIVRMLLYVKRAIEQYCKFFIFDFIDDITKRNLEVGINGFLEDIRRRRGIQAYAVNIHADEYAIMRKTMYIEIELKPTKVLEKIILNFYI